MGPLSGGKTTGTWEPFYLIATLRFKAAQEGGIRSALPVLASTPRRKLCPVCMFRAVIAVRSEAIHAAAHRCSPGSPRPPKRPRDDGHVCQEFRRPVLAFREGGTDLRACPCHWQAIAKKVPPLIEPPSCPLHRPGRAGRFYQCAGSIRNRSFARYVAGVESGRDFCPVNVKIQVPASSDAAEASYRPATTSLKVSLRSARFEAGRSSQPSMARPATGAPFASATVTVSGDPSRSLGFVGPMQRFLSALLRERGVVVQACFVGGAALLAGKCVKRGIEEVAVHRENNAESA